MVIVHRLPTDVESVYTSVLENVKGVNQKGAVSAVLCGSLVEGSGCAHRARMVQKWVWRALIGVSGTLDHLAPLRMNLRTVARLTANAATNGKPDMVIPHAHRNAASPPGQAYANGSPKLTI
jgi:hypothetical protein